MTFNSSTVTPETSMISREVCLTNVMISGKYFTIFRPSSCQRLHYQYVTSSPVQSLHGHDTTLFQLILILLVVDFIRKKTFIISPVFDNQEGILPKGGMGTTDCYIEVFKILTHLHSPSRHGKCHSCLHTFHLEGTVRVNQFQTGGNDFLKILWNVEMGNTGWKPLYWIVMQQLTCCKWFHLIHLHSRMHRYRKSPLAHKIHLHNWKSTCSHTRHTLNEK